MADRDPSRLTHFDADGNAHMVDVGGKSDTQRTAIATGVIRMTSGTASLIRAGSAAKGDVIGVARIAAIMAAKRTSELVPLCHPLPLSHIAVDITVEDAAVRMACTVRTTGKTGVEMEALTAVSVGLLTIYDMVKAVDRGMELGEIRLAEKRGGASGDWVRPAD